MPGLWELVDVCTFKPNSHDMEIWARMPTCIMMDFGLSIPFGHAVKNLGLLNPFYARFSDPDRTRPGGQIVKTGFLSIKNQICC